MPSFDRVCLSVDANTDYLDLLPIACQGWRKFFPEAKITVACVDPSTIEFASKWCDETVSVAIGGPTSNAAKVARYVAAAMHPYEICLIHDADSTILCREFTLAIVSGRRCGRMLVCGAEKYEGLHEEGKWPVSHMTGEGYLFGRMGFGTGEFQKIRRVFDPKESHLSSPDVFSDESLLRALCHVYQIPLILVTEPKHEILDRSKWPNAGIANGLASHHWGECNLPRGRHNWQHRKPVADYLFGRDVSEGEVAYPG